MKKFLIHVKEYNHDNTKGQNPLWGAKTEYRATPKNITKWKNIRRRRRKLIRQPLTGTTEPTNRIQGKAKRRKKLTPEPRTPKTVLQPHHNTKWQRKEREGNQETQDKEKAKIHKARKKNQ
ncbi:hypothetical protein [Bacteroides graminisolvens]|uniref:hypothetical protein n=1 Tax=Bacteroides graminisolvens TaxID=477666 RepID=UPI000487B3A5|nr:hypothetical protein [Bacteroides graminisolvens]